MFFLRRILLFLHIFVIVPTALYNVHWPRQAIHKQHLVCELLQNLSFFWEINDLMCLKKALLFEMSTSRRKALKEQCNRWALVV